MILEDIWEADGQEIETRGFTRGRWSMGSRNQGVVPGDQILLVRQIRDRGIVRSGFATSEVFQGRHFDEDERAAGKMSNYVDVHWTQQVDMEDRLPTEVLLDVFPEISWNALLGSGVQVPEEVAPRLIALWHEYSGGSDTISASQQRNPDWTWDEEVLAFDVYLRCGPVGDEHPEVQDLSALLRSLPIHLPENRADTFRNPNGVARKLGDIHTHRPGYIGRPTSGSRLDRRVWEQLGNNEDHVYHLAVAIKAGAFLAATPEDDEAEVEDLHPEGRISYRIHRRRERDPRLRKNKLRAMLRSGGLHCEACDADLEGRYGTSDACVYECHHLVPLSVTGETVNGISDVALLCPTCHRIAHRVTPWPTLVDLRSLATSGTVTITQDQGETE
jgi:5-methylcytosine-specific restriction protein A